MAHQPGVIRIQSNPKTPNDMTGRNARVWINGQEITYMTRGIKMDLGLDHANFITLELVGVIETVDPEVDL